MSFQDLISEVQMKTARKDASARPLIVRSIRDAIRKVHASAHFARDLVLYNPSFTADPSGGGTVTLAYPADFRMTNRIIPQFSGVTFTEPLHEYTYKAPTLAGYPYDMYYREIGSGVQVTYSCNPSGFVWEYFAYPQIDISTVNSETTDSWIVNLAPSCVVNRACAMFFNATGDDNGVRTFTAYADIEMAELQQNFKTLD